MEHEGDRKCSSRGNRRRPMIRSSNADDEDDDGFSSLSLSLPLHPLCLLYFKRKTDVATGFLFICTKSERGGMEKKRTDFDVSKMCLVPYVFS